MAEDKPSTPEQQLLKLIEGQGKDAGNNAPAAKPKSSHVSIEVAIDQAVGRFFGKLSFLRRSGKALTKRRRVPLDITNVNRVLLVTVAAVFLYVLFDAAASATSLRRPTNFVPPMDMSLPFAKDTIEPLKESSYYLQKVASRNIFREGRRPQETKEKTAGNDAPDEASAVIQGLSLVGISWSANPDAIIEDKTNQRTFFVKRGQKVGDAVKVEAIFKDHVVLSYEDKEFELR